MRRIVTRRKVRTASHRKRQRDILYREMRLVGHCLLLCVISHILAAETNSSTSAESCENLSCCALDKDVLSKCGEKSSRCPGFVGFGYLKENSTTSTNEECGPCPPGECRIGTTCVCPKDFMESKVLKDQCADSFGVSWPKSVGEVDANCTTGTITEKKSRWERLKEERIKSIPGIASAGLVALVAGSFYAFMQWRRQG